MNTYITSNLYLAAFLWQRGYPLEVAPTPGARRVSFIFPAEASEAAAEYIGGANIQAAAYADFLARLKARVVAAHTSTTQNTTHARFNHVRTSSTQTQQ